MTTFAKLIAFAAISCSVIVSSCEKDKNDNKVTRKSLPMEGAQEVPVRTTPARGSFDVTYNRKTHILDYAIEWSALTGNPIGSHIHGPAPRGVNAGIKYDFTSTIPKTTSGTIVGSVLVDGVAIKEDSLLAGFYYFNIHTPTNPGGEIRGQIEFK